MARVSSSLARPKFWSALVSRIRLSVRLLREPSVSLWVKAVPAAAIAYLVLPLDIAPDFLPVLGQLDDIGMLFVALEAFLFLCPSPAVEFHRTSIALGRAFTPMPPGDTFIDAAFRHDA
jgi:uncharacterized membrane protein YkvA (DUF1232 family)